MKDPSTKNLMPQTIQKTGTAQVSKQNSQFKTSNDQYLQISCHPEYFVKETW